MAAPRDGGGERQHIVIERAGMAQVVGGGRIEACHDLLFAAKSAKGQAAAEILAHGHHVRCHPADPLVATRAEARGHDFIENQHCAVLFAQVLEGL